MIINSVFFLSILYFAIIDILKHKIFNRDIIIVTILLLAFILFLEPESLVPRLLGAVTIFGVLFLIFLLSKGQFGAGDVKLGFIIGLGSSFPTAFFVLPVAFIAGGLFALFGILSKRMTKTTHIPFAPFLFLGAIFAPVMNTYFFQGNLI